MAVVCGYGPMNPQPWMMADQNCRAPPGRIGVKSVVKMDTNLGPGQVVSDRVFMPQDLGQFGSEVCRNPSCKCQVLKSKSYGYVRHVRRMHGLPTQLSRRMCEYGNIHVDSRFLKPLSVDTGTEYELPKHLYPPMRSDPILMIHPSYKRYLGIKQCFPAPCTHKTFIPSCADLGIPVSQPQLFKQPSVPTASKRAKQDFPLTQQYQPVYSQAPPPPYWASIKENGGGMQPFYAQASTSVASLDQLNARDMMFQQSQAEATTAMMKMPTSCYSSTQSLDYGGGMTSATSTAESAMQNTRRMPKSGKTRAMRFHSFHGDRES
ncbi:unnamed protein product [Notodromas monacha]|uniref:Uncharacterized protein n=1 Tax=Notodromas monacha TaxID=399045 RepID=A0A7R9BDY7_9CRUS|nr:unnamed protein product [Notodromas monacha]CAG0912895.1 unnamed protein product [Notodromas monacha]